MLKLLEGFTFGRKKTYRPEIGKNDRQSFFRIFLSKFWNLITLNLLYIICIVPVVTFGPATAAMTKILRNYSQERSCFLFSDFFSAFKSNFKQAFIIGLFDVIAIAAYIYGIIYYAKAASTNGGTYTLLFSSLLFSLFYLIMAHFYIYLMIVSIKLPLGKIIKNSLILAIIELKRNALTLLITLAIFALLILTFPYSIAVIPFIPLSFMGLIVCYNSYPIIRKHVIQPYYEQLGEQNPEFEYLVKTGNELADYRRKNSFNSDNSANN
ncbi:MAG: DUF624 domain-containing protein [Oscillospiraceae bacterium]